MPAKEISHTPERDPYAPPPRHRDGSGAILRVVILGAMIAGVAWTYFSFAGSEQSAGLTPAVEQNVAETLPAPPAASTTSESPSPEAAPEPPPA